MCLTSDAAFYAFLLAIIGLGLLLFGVRIMKLSVTIIGFFIGMTLGAAALSALNAPHSVELIGAVVVGLICAPFAFRFYKFAAALGVAFVAANFMFAITTVYDLSVALTLILALLAGLLTFFVVRTFKLVEAAFALGTSLQGANSLVVAAYLFVNPGQISSLEAHKLTSILAIGGWWYAAWLALATIGFISQIWLIHRDTAEAAPEADEK